MRERSRARGWALQVLYAWEAKGGETKLKAVLHDFTSERNIAEASRAYLLELLQTVEAHSREIDQALESSLTNWRLERLSAIDRNVLRIGAAEMLYITETPPRVAIREAILLAEKYGTAESPRFVNGVLDALMRRTAEGRGGAGAATRAEG